MQVLCCALHLLASLFPNYRLLARGYWLRSNLELRFNSTIFLTGLYDVICVLLLARDMVVRKITAQKRTHDQKKQRPILNFAPGAKLSPRGELCPLGVKLSPEGEII
jgi:hypothetical protein